jgi:hypothetical protein
VAEINGFDISKDALQVHDFGGSHAGISGYQARTGSTPGQFDIYTYAGTGLGEQVASVHVTSGTLDLTKTVRLI